MLSNCTSFELSMLLPNASCHAHDSGFELPAFERSFFALIPSPPPYSTTTSKPAVAELPDASVAVQVTGVVPRLNVLPDTGSHVSVGGEVMASVAETLSLKSTTVPDKLVIAAYTIASRISMTGAVTSLTVTVKSAVVVFPAPSVAVHETGVTPKPKTDPDGGVQSIVGASPELSVATMP